MIFFLCNSYFPESHESLLMIILEQRSGTDLFLAAMLNPFLCLFKFINECLNHSLFFSWIKVKALRVRVFVQFGNLFFLS